MMIIIKNKQIQVKTDQFFVHFLNILFFNLSTQNQNFISFSLLIEKLQYNTARTTF